MAASIITLIPLVHNVTMRERFELTVLYDLRWFEAILDYGHKASQSCDLLMIGYNHERDFISSHETLKHITESQ